MSVSVQDIVAAQAHIGTLKNEAHPKTSKYWSEVTNGVVVINPEVIAEQLEAAKAQVAAAKAAGKEILVVCEKKMYAEELEALAQKAGVAFLNYKVSGGFLTNFDTFKKRIDSINEMVSYMESDAFASLTKKEQLVYKRNFERANKVYKGVTKLKKRPELVIIVDGNMLSTLIDEVENLKGKLEAIVIAGAIAIVAFRVSRQHLRYTIAASSEFTTDAQVSEDLRDLIQTVTIAGSCATVGVCLIAIVLEHFTIPQIAIVTGVVFFLDVGLARLTGKSWALAELAATRDLEIPYGWWGSLLSTGRI